MKKILLILILFFGFTTSSSAESVYVQYRGNVSLDSFNCQYTESSIVNRICYQQQNNYVLASLNGTYYHYCRVPNYVTNEWLSSSSKGSFYNSNIKGRFDCRDNTNSPQTLPEMGWGIGQSIGKALTGILDNPMKGKRYYERGTTWIFQGINGFSNDGMKCTVKNDYYFLSCNNGVSYYDCDNADTVRYCGTDGSIYTSDWNGNDSNYCVTSNFGSKCCGDSDKKTCR